MPRQIRRPEFRVVEEKSRAAERERCAKICDDLARENRVTRKGEGASLCADRIRKSADLG